MRTIKTLSLAVALALSLMASAIATSASASVLTAGQFPAVIRAEAVGGHIFTTHWLGKMECSGATFESELSKPAESFETKWNTPFENCYAFGSAPLKQNGCGFIFRPGPLTGLGVAQGRFDIGPAGCGPMVRESALCRLSIGAQSGLPATFEDVVVEGRSEVKISANATNLKYSQSNGCGLGTYEDGTYEGTWLAKGEAGGFATNTWVEEEAHAPRFEAEEYPAAISGEQSSEGKHVFTVDKFTASCGKATFSGEASGATSAITLTPKYSECQAFGMNATVALNGCAYIAHAGSAIENGSKYAGTVDVSCPEGKKVKINAGFGECIVEIGSQTGLSGLEMQNTGSPYSVLARANVTGIVYTVTQDGPLCPLSGKGTFSNSSYVGSTLISGSLSGGRQIGVYAKGQ